MAIIPVRTWWIDEAGMARDVEAFVGRRGDDVHEFAIHTLGWMYFQEIGKQLEVRFNPAVTAAAAVQAAAVTVRDCLQNETGLVTVRAFCGQKWISEAADAAGLDRIIDWIETVVKSGRPRLPQGAIAVEKLTDADFARYSDPRLELIMSIWQATAGVIEMSFRSPWVRMPWGGPRAKSNTKILKRSPSGELIISAYQPSSTALWDQATMEEFVHNPVLSCVPDRGLGTLVVRSAECTLQARHPRIERFTGACERSDHTLEALDWIRVSLPARYSGGGAADAVVVYCKRIESEPSYSVAGAGDARA